MTSTHTLLNDIVTITHFLSLQMYKSHKLGQRLEKKQASLFYLQPWPDQPCVGPRGPPGPPGPRGYEGPQGYRV